MGPTGPTGPTERRTNGSGWHDPPPFTAPVFRRKRRPLSRSHDDLSRYIADNELLALLKRYEFTFGHALAYDPSGTSRERMLDLGFGAFPLALIALVFADPAGRQALTRLLDSYRAHRFTLRVYESTLFGGWGYAVAHRRGAPEIEQQAPTLLDAWIEAAQLVARVIAGPG